MRISHLMFMGFFLGSICVLNSGAQAGLLDSLEEDITGALPKPIATILAVNKANFTREFQLNPSLSEACGKVSSLEGDIPEKGKLRDEWQNAFDRCMNAQSTAQGITE